LTEIGNENEQLKSKLEGESALREEFDTIFKKVRMKNSKVNFLAKNRATRIQICFLRVGKFN
jgi:hypothetical protein